MGIAQMIKGQWEMSANQFAKQKVWAFIQMLKVTMIQQIKPPVGNIVN